MDAYDAEAMVAQAERHLVTAQYAQCEELAAALLERAARSRGEDGGCGSAPPRFVTDAGYMLLQVLHVTDRCVRAWLVGSRGRLASRSRERACPCCVGGESAWCDTMSGTV
jgi:hypothetical protein